MQPQSAVPVPQHGFGFALREFVRMHPTPGSHHVAPRAGVSVGVPLLAVIALGHPRWTA